MFFINLDTATWRIFGAMLLRCKKVLLPTIQMRLINQCIWATLNIVVFGYIMDISDMKNFIALTMPISVAYFISLHCIYPLILGITTADSNLSYELSLPIPQWLVFIKYGLEYACTSLICAIPVLPFAYILSCAGFPLTLIGILKYYLVMICTALMGGFFALMLCSKINDMGQDLDNMWVRIIFPLWFLGCFQFSWLDLYKASKPIAYLDLLNPLTYALEGGRAAILFTDTSLNYWLCIVMLLLFTILFAYIATKRLLKRLDCL